MVVAVTCIYRQNPSEIQAKCDFVQLFGGNGMSHSLPDCYGGEILHVKLNTGNAERERIDPADAQRFLGGNGLAAKLIHEYVPADSDPFDAENVLVFAIGPMTATPFQSTSRGVAGFISPMTNGFFDSTFGGTFPQAQKTTGFDLIALHGKADDLSYVYVDENGAECKDATDLQGKDTYETCEAVRDREGEGYSTHVIAAEPAGENQARYACLVHQGRDREGVAGRGGGGAVLGSKNVKAVAIREGSFEPEVAAESEFRDFTAGQMGRIMEETEMLQTYGTSGLVNPINEMGKLGRRNNQTEQTTDENAEAVSGETLKAEYITEDTICVNCAVRCGKHVSVENEGRTKAKIPEFESLFGTTTMQDVYDIQRVIKANDLRDRLGMDTINWDVTVAFARECYEKGLLTDEESPYLEFGDADGLVELSKQTAHREGFGDVLAEGSFRVAEQLDEGFVEKVVSI